MKKNGVSAEAEMCRMSCKCMGQRKGGGGGGAGAGMCWRCELDDGTCK